MIIVENVSGVLFIEVVDIVIVVCGNFNDFVWLEIFGFDIFKGKKIYLVVWDQNYDFKNKKIGIIGGGLSFI